MQINQIFNWMLIPNFRSGSASGSEIAKNGNFQIKIIGIRFIWGAKKSCWGPIMQWIKKPFVRSGKLSNIEIARFDPNRANFCFWKTFFPKNRAKIFRPLPTSIFSFFENQKFCPTGVENASRCLTCQIRWAASLSTELWVPNLFSLMLKRTIFISSDFL